MFKYIPSIPFLSSTAAFFIVTTTAQSLTCRFDDAWMRGNKESTDYSLAAFTVRFYLEWKHVLKE